MYNRRAKSRTLFIILSLLNLCMLGIGAFVFSYFGVSMSPDGNWIVVTDSFGVSIYESGTGKMVDHTFGRPYGFQPYGQGLFSYIKWSPDNKYLAIGKKFNGVWVWNVDTWKIETEWTNKDDYGQSSEPSFTWSPDSQKLAMGTGSGEIWMWDKVSDKWFLNSSANEGLIGIEWYQNGQLVMLKGHDLYNVQDNKSVGRLNHWIDGYGKVSWSPDDTHLFVFFDLGGGVIDISANVGEYSAGYFPEFAWSNDGRYFASVKECDNEIAIWDTISNTEVLQEPQGNAIYALSFTPNNDLLALGLMNMQVTIWNTSTMDTLIRLHSIPPLGCIID